MWAVIAAIIAVVGGAIVSHKAVAAQKKAAEKEKQKQLQAGLRLAGEESALTKSEMTMQVGQRKIQGLMDVLQTPPAPRVFMLPSAAPEPTWVDKINQSIHSLVTGG